MAQSPRLLRPWVYAGALYALHVLAVGIGFIVVAFLIGALPVYAYVFVFVRDAWPTWQEAARIGLGWLAILGGGLAIFNVPLPKWLRGR